MLGFNHRLMRIFECFDRGWIDILCGQFGARRFEQDANAPKFSTGLSPELRDGNSARSTRLENGIRDQLEDRLTSRCDADAEVLRDFSVSKPAAGLHFTQ